MDKASIEAVALDPSRSPLPRVTVTVTRPDTGYEAVLVTDTLGLARFASLSPGEYTASSRSQVAEAGKKLETR